MGEENELEPNTQPKDGPPADTEPSAEPAESAEGAAAGPAASVVASGADSAKGLTPGQRLALKRGKKSQQKQELRAEIKQREESAQAEEQEEAERILGVNQPASTPDPVQQTASELTHYVQSNRGWIIGGVVGVLALGFGIILSRSHMSSGDAEQATLLASAVELANAEIDENNKEGKDADGKATFTSASERAAAATEAFAAAAKQDPDSLAGHWAKLGQASSLVGEGKASAAAPLFAAVYGARKDRPTLGAQALEGEAIALEAAGKTDEALARYDALKGYDAGAYKDLAEYHIARIKLASGDQEAAKTLLKGAYDRLNSPAEGAPKSRYLKGEVEVRLAELDSSLVPAGSGEAQQFSPEEIQRLIRQMQMQQQGGTAPAGSGGE